MLRPGPLGLLLARTALPFRDATAGAPRRHDFRHAARDRCLVEGGLRPSPRLSQPPGDIHVAVPRPLESRSAGLGLARSLVELWPQPHVHAVGCAPRRAAADAAVPA